jgi:hypothetical protein
MRVAVIDRGGLRARLLRRIMVRNMRGRIFASVISAVLDRFLKLGPFAWLSARFPLVNESFQSTAGPQYRTREQRNSNIPNERGDQVELARSSFVAFPSG